MPGAPPSITAGAEYFPDDDLTIVVLFNTAGPTSPGVVAEQIAEAVVGKPTLRSLPFEGDYRDLAGTYVGVGRGNSTELTIVADGDALTAMFGESEADTLRYLGDDTFAQGSTRIEFDRENGRVSEVRVDMVYGYSTLRPR